MVGFQNTSPPLTAEPPLKGKPSNAEEFEYYHNASFLEHGGSPDSATKTAFTYAIDKYIKATGKYNKNESKIGFSDIEDSLLIVINSFSTMVSYANQTKKAITNEFIKEGTNHMKLQVKNISVTFEGKRILEDLCLDVAEGEFVALIGPSGCGKSTLPKPEYGRITANGKKLYFHLFENTVGPVPLMGLKKDEIASIRLLATGAEIPLSTSWVHSDYPSIVFANLGLDPVLPDEIDTVLEVTLK